MKTEQFASSTHIALRPTALDDLASLLLPEAHQAVVWLDHQVRVGSWSPDGFAFYQPEPWQLGHIQRLRVFNTHEELHLWRSSQGLMGRLRRETGAGELIEAVRARQILIGTASEPLGDYSRIYEDRGYELFLPLPDVALDRPGKRCYVETLNYIAYNDLGQTGYIDCRFVSLGIIEGGN